MNYAEPIFGIQQQGELRIHPESTCEGEFCCFHNPSDHHMRDWPRNVRLDKGALTERICPHGVGHPDPDSLAWLVRVSGEDHWGVHGCDGSCWS